MFGRMFLARVDPLFLLLAALALDAAIGDPPWLYRHVPHPVALLGRLISFFDRRLNRESRAETERRWRGALVVLVVAGIAAAVGFVHGFWFAIGLRSMDLPARAVGWSLLSFNAGAEFAGLATIVTAGAAMAASWRMNEGAAQRMMRVGSTALIAAGAFWFVQRLFFPGVVL